MTQATTPHPSTGQSSQPDTPAPPRERTPLRIGIPILAHTAVDFVSFITIALLPLLAVKLKLTPEDKSILIAVGAISSGAIQPLVAWIGDKLNTRVIGTLGVILAGACIGMVGRAESFHQLLLLYAFGAMGVGAFHPAATACVGHMAGIRRSGMLAVFFLAGMLGGISGNMLSPKLVDLLGHLSGLEGPAATQAGLRSLVWVVVPCLAVALILALTIHKHDHRATDAHDTHRSLPSQERAGRWFAFWMLYLASILRFATNLALIYLFVEWIEHYVAATEGVETLTVELGAHASSLNGPLQAAMQTGMGGAGLVLGFFLRPRHEKLAFTLIPTLGTIPIILFPFVDSLPQAAIYPAALALGLAAGAGFGGLIPVSLSLGQRLLPHRTSFTSGMMLGGAWIFASLGAQLAKVLHVGAKGSFLDFPPFSVLGGESGRGLDTAFWGIACLLFCSAILGMLLPGNTLKNLRAH